MSDATLLNSSCGLLSSDPLKILHKFGLTNYYIGSSIGHLTPLLELTCSRTSTIELPQVLEPLFNPLMESLEHLELLQ
jgi:hypothetical protein